MSEREEFVSLALHPEVSMSVLCRRFGISRKSGYKWLARFKAGGTAALADESRRPHASPRRSDDELEKSVVELRQKHRAWGGRKIKKRLEDMGQADVCSPGTVTRILHRHGLIEPSAARSHRPFVRFEHPFPNDLWQMDFKGHFALLRGGRCHPLTILDDHSRYSLVLKSCGNQQTETVRGHLVCAFERYGMPHRILCDNGSPWAGSGSDSHTPLELWLLRLGVGMIHGRPFHPQTQGKDERFHKTLIEEVLRWQAFDDLAASQAAFDPWREIYNTERPHEGIGMDVPAKRYQPSPRNYPSVLPEVVYPSTDLVRKVSGNSGIILNGKRYGIGKPFRGQHVGLRPTAVDGVWDVFYCNHRVGGLDEKTGGPMTREASDPLAGFAPPPAAS
jgi:transposase InsO family protein